MIVELSNDTATDTIVAQLAALAHPHRLQVFRLLVQRGPEGANAGEIAEELGLAPSSLAFHTQALVRAGLARDQRLGRHVIYRADFAAMRGLVDYLSRNCCSGAPC